MDFEGERACTMHERSGTMNSVRSCTMMYDVRSFIVHRSSYIVHFTLSPKGHDCPGRFIGWNVEFEGKGRVRCMNDRVR